MSRYVSITNEDGRDRDGSNDIASTHNSKLLGRRSFLGAAGGIAAAAAAGAGLPSVGAADEGDVVDVVDDLGCDPTGTEPVQHVVTGAVRPGVTLHFPAGRYLIDGTISVDGVDDVTIAGDDGAEFVVGNFYGYVLRVEGASGFRLDGLDVDQTVTNNAGNVAVFADDWELSDVTIYGDERNPQPGANGDHKFNVGVVSPDSTGVIRDCQVRGYTDLGRYRDVTGGIRASTRHHGTLYVQNTYVEGRGNNGAYCSRTNGPVIFEGCEHRNNNGAQFRIGHPESRVENCVAALDDRDLPDWVSAGRDANWRGLRAESDNRFDHGHAGAQFVETDVVVEHGEEFPIHSGIQIQRRWGGATIDACRVDVNANARAIAIDTVDWSEISGEETAVTIRDTTITSTASDGHLIVVGADRDGTRIENSCLDHAGEDGTGVVAESHVEFVDVSVDGSCGSDAASSEDQ